MTKSTDRAAMAREILADVLADPAAAQVVARFVSAIELDEARQPLPVYSEESGAGFGGYLCEYSLLPAIETAIAECDRELYRLAGPSLSPSARAAFVRTLAMAASRVLLVNMRAKLREAVEQNLDEALTVAKSVLYEYAAELKDRRGGETKIDAREYINPAAEAAARGKREHLGKLLSGFRKLMLKSLPGRPAQVTEARVRELLREHGKVSAEKAAELLGCSTRAVKTWGAKTPQGSWAKARDALMPRMK